MHMNASRALLSILLLSATAAAHAQLYKWVGPDGKVTYSDTPPPAAARNVETRQATTAPGGAGLPFELAEAAKNHPVTLYTSTPCAPCDQGRSLLNARGVPFTEKTVSSAEDLARLKEVGGDAQLPMLLVGRSRQKGFSPDGWGTALTAAGYPEANRLPKGYRNAPAEAAAPAPAVASKQVAKPAQPAQRPAEDVPPAAGNAPPGFRF